jgi:hypothetical protein
MNPRVTPQPVNEELTMVHWRRYYLPLIAQRPAGASTALRVTIGWAQTEVAYAEQLGTDPQPGSPPH